MRVTAPSRRSLPPRPSDQVVAAASDQGVVVGVADDRVVVRAAQHVVDAEGVGERQGERAVIERGRHDRLRPGLAEIDRDPGGGLREIEPGDAGARRLNDGLAAARSAVECECIVAAAADQRIVARAADQRVGAARADQRVVAGAAR